MSVSQLNEARYGRACLLVLNICPVTLRRVIDHYCSTKGFNDLEGLLNHTRNKHDLFHLSFGQCCCGHTSRNKPLRKQQWDLLYCKTNSNIPHEQQGQCYCMYSAIPGVTSDVMDVTLCCLVLKNICRGINNVDIDAISSVRNQLIHASSATLKDTAYNDLWKKVETAVLNLAKKVDSVLEIDTKGAVQEMKDRIMNPGDLCSLKDLISEQKCMDELRQRMDKIETTQLLYKRDKGDFPQEKIEQMQQVLLKINAGATNVQITPLLKTGKKLPVNQIYAPVKISEKPPTLLPGQTSLQTREIKSPKDMFYKDGEPVRYIFLEGEAGRGKTMFSRQILQYWCTAKQSNASRYELGEWEKGIDEFDFVFPIFLRHVNKTRTSLVDMICQDLFKHNSDCEDAIRHVVSSDKYRCLFIIDGLDEWNIAMEIKGKLTHDEIPDIEGTSCCSFLFASRPWKLLEVTNILESCDRHIQIDGLTADGRVFLIENILLNFYDMKRDNDSFKRKKDEIEERLFHTKMESILEIPLLVLISTILLFKKGHLADNLTNFYIALVQMLIKETLGKKSLDRPPSRRLTESKIKIPKIFQSSKNRTICGFSNVLEKLGQIAYKDLVSSESSLVFAREELEEQLTQPDLEFALKVGLLSQCEAPGCFDEENVSVNFFHKNVQEFLAAFHVVCRDKLKAEEFCGHLSDVEKILELSNVVLFVCGLSETLGRIVLEHTVGVVDQDHDVLKWRDCFDLKCHSKVSHLCRFYLTCYLEMKLYAVEEERVLFYGKDVVLDIFTYPDPSVTSEFYNLLQNGLCNEIVSLYLGLVHFDIDTVSEFLQHTECLQSLRIFGTPITQILGIGKKLPLRVLDLIFVTLTPEAWRGLTMSLRFSKQLKHLKMLSTKCSVITKEKYSHPSDFFEQLPTCSNFSSMEIDFTTLEDRKDRNSFLYILPCLNNLEHFEYKGAGILIKTTNDDFEIEVFQEVLKISQIRHIKLSKINITISPPYKSLEMLPTWSQIEMLVLREVLMDSVHWLRFISSLEKVQCEFNVIMIRTNVDDRTVLHLDTSPHFEVSFKEKDSIYFTKVYGNPPHINRDILSLVKANPLLTL